MAEARRASRSWGGAHLLGGLGAALEQLQHDRPLQQRVVGQEHHAAAAGADLAEELVLLDDAALHGCIIAVRPGWISGVSTVPASGTMIFERKFMGSVRLEARILSSV